MRIERDRSAAGPIVTGFTADGFRTLDGVFAALAMTVEAAAGWSPPPLDALTLDDLTMVLTPEPEFVLLGTGATTARAPRALSEALAARGIGLEAMDSRAAARAWGVLRGEGRQIAAALYPFTIESRQV